MIRNYILKLGTWKLNFMKVNYLQTDLTNIIGEIVLKYKVFPQMLPMKLWKIKLPMFLSCLTVLTLILNQMLSYSSAKIWPISITILHGNVVD